MTEFRDHLVEGAAATQRKTDLTVARQVAGGGQDQVAEPGQPHEGLGARAKGDTQS